METHTPEAAAIRFEAEHHLDLDFPPLPRTVTEVAAMLSARDEVPDTPRLVEIVGADPVIALSVLRRVNSAFYGLRRQVGEVRHAVFLLGFEEVCNLVLTASVLRLRDVLRTPEQEAVFDDLLRMSLGAGFYAQVLADHLDLPVKRAAFAAGLLHNVGRLVFLYNVPNEYEALWYTSPTGHLPSIHDEERIFGLDHGELGARAGLHWNLPERIVEVLRFYCVPGLAPDGPSQRFAQVIAVAAAASTQLCLYEPAGPTWTFAPPTVLPALCDGAHADPHDVITFVEAQHARVRQYVSMMAHG